MGRVVGECPGMDCFFSSGDGYSGGRPRWSSREMAAYPAQTLRPEHAADASAVALRPRLGSGRLFVLWRAPDDGTRLPIGELWRMPAGFAFGYVDDLKGAFERGFRLLTEFPVHQTCHDPYRSAYLFPTFAQRIPSPK